MIKLDKKNIEDIFSLTPMQEGMLFHYLKDPGSDIYFEQLSLEIAGTIDNKVFEKAWNWVIQTNEMLRAVFRWEKVEQPIQIILKEHGFQPRYVDLTGKDHHLLKNNLEKIKAEDRNEKFDLREIPFRITLCKVEAHKYEMIVSSHHILYDGWSNSIVMGEFLSAYNDLTEGKLLKPQVKTKFKEFVKWLRDRETTKQEEFWKEYLEDFNPGTVSPVKRSKRKEIKSTGNYHIKLPGEMTDQLEGFVKNRNITIASLVYSVWGILLQHYNSTNDVLFDTTVSGRTAKVKEIENMVGLFINTLPLRVQTNPGEKISALLSRMYHMLQRRGIFENSSPLIINEYLHERHKEQLFDSVVVLENYPLDRILMQENGPFTVNSFWISGMTVYNLSVIVTIFDDMKVNVTYNKNRFDRDSILILSHHFTAIFREILDNPDKTIGELEPLPEKERKKNLFSPGKQINIDKVDKSISRKSVADKNNEMDVMAESLVRIWEEVMGKRPGLDDDFFEIGGNSLELVRIYKQVNARYPGKIKVNDFFANPTIRKLKQVLISKDVHHVGIIVDKKKIRNIDF